MTPSIPNWYWVQYCWKRVIRALSTNWTTWPCHLDTPLKTTPDGLQLVLLTLWEGRLWRYCYVRAGGENSYMGMMLLSWVLIYAWTASNTGFLFSFWLRLRNSIKRERIRIPLSGNRFHVTKCESSLQIKCCGRLRMSGDIWICCCLHQVSSYALNTSGVRPPAMFPIRLPTTVWYVPYNVDLRCALN